MTGALQAWLQGVPPLLGPTIRRISFFANPRQVYTCDPRQFGALPTCDCEPEKPGWRLNDQKNHYTAVCSTCDSPYRIPR